MHTSRWNTGHGHEFPTLFVIPIAIILFVTVMLGGMIAGQGLTGVERGKAAVAAVQRMQILLGLQSNLSSERIATNLILAVPYPLPEFRRDGSPRYGKRLTG